MVDFKSLSTMKALLIIDMQRGSFKPETPRHDANGVVNRINLLSDYFRLNRNPVIFIQHDGSKLNEYMPGTSEWRILSSLNQKPEDKIVSKTANDSFYNSELDAILKEKNIKELVITGCATDFCVDATIRSALSRDYKVTIIEDCHTTANRPHITAEKVIEHHNWIWANMIPTKGKTVVISFEQYLNSWIVTSEPV